MSAWWKEVYRFPLLHRAVLVWILLLSLLSIGLNLLLPWPMKLIVDHVLGSAAVSHDWLWLPGSFRGQDKVHQLAWLVLASAVLFLLVRLTEMGRIYLATKIGRRMQYELGDVLFHRLQLLSPAFHAGSQTGDLVRRVTMDSKCVDEFFLGICIPAFTAVLMLAAMFTTMMNMSWEIAALALLMAMPIALLVRQTYPQRSRNNRLSSKTSRDK